MARFTVGCACEVAAALNQGGLGELLRNTSGIAAPVVAHRDALAARKMHGAGAQHDPQKVDECHRSNGRHGVESETQRSRFNHHADSPAASACRSTGSFRKRTPVAANSALASAGAAAAVPGSPIPPGASVL